MTRPRRRLLVYLRNGRLFLPAEATDPDGITLLVPPVEVLPHPPELPRLAEAMERTARRSGKTARRAAASDPLGPVGRAAGCRTAREFADGLRLVTIDEVDGRIEIAPGLPARKGGFEFGDALRTLPAGAGWLDLARAVASLLADERQVSRPQGPTTE